MKILIIEDEVKTASALSRHLHAMRPGTIIAGAIQSVEEAVLWFNRKEPVDLVFMDIQLTDGACFDIFKSVKVEAPVIFCTAYSEYTTQAFKNNGIDYILKPFTQADIENALLKVEHFSSFFQRTAQADTRLLDLLKSISGEKQGKTSFLVFHQHSYINLSTSEIKYFYKSLTGVFAVTDESHEYPMKESLDEIQRLLAPRDFYRINRQYIIAFKSIQEVQHYFDRRLTVTLVVKTAEKLIVGREKATSFLHWLGDR
ncbi:DNA-binding response regulator, LytR/AlgR family [Chitinophaga eiseniae]|uniref:DNA-binding response regulator, LytR/AlgR family n=1 Tax=Chitinophaga eiseniae TaxID=634771 RepID=A0A1T4SYH4_9BACT|nr:LytTR family DNA-binding domain-containing protein [Chitinophaga eiseniae]SKA33290.1 DNA-binding response regulator, LytR/AlgR family [Chitinophaga eiseniae]